jgi:riboflavin kinase/FMN adenylyltransferase
MPLPTPFDSLASVSLPPQPVHLAIGMFDGVHLGHQAVIESAIHSARRTGGLVGVLTFWPHPSAFFNPDHRTRLIMNPAMKLSVLLQLGVDFVVQQPFTSAFARIEAGEFLPHLRQCLPRLTSLYVGENWRFGRGRQGDVPFLVAQARALGLAVVSAERINRNGEPISSTRIRTHLEAGEMEEANALLGYSYFAEGKVEAGRRLGRQLGFPTLNLPWAPDCAPRHAVYAVRVTGAKAAAPLPGVANFGLRPTVGPSTAPLLEVHVLGDCPFTTGDPVRVDWLAFLRPEQKFAGPDDLRAQIARDCESAAHYFAGK